MLGSQIAIFPGTFPMNMTFKPLGLAVALALAGCNQAAPPADTAAAPDAMAEAPAVAEAPVAAPEAAVVAAPQLQAAMRGLWHGHNVDSHRGLAFRSEEPTGQQGLLAHGYFQKRFGCSPFRYILKVRICTVVPGC